MPRAVIADEFGPISNYQLREHDPGPPRPGQIRVAVKAAGVSFVDVLTAAGKYQVTPPLPFIPGSEAAGIVEAVGEGLTGHKPGDAVVVTNFGGLFTEAGNFSAKTARPLPAGMSFEEGAVFPSSYFTAWHALVDRAQLKAGETLLVLGAGGATGYAAIQTAKHLGARVIGSASSEAKRALATAGGADVVVDARAESWRKDVLAANGGKPVDVVFDPICGAAMEPAFRSLAPYGRHLIVGFTGGIASLPANLPLLKGASLVGVSVRQFGETRPEAAAQANRAIFELAGGGVLKPAIAERYPIERYADAMVAAESGAPAGRVVITMA